MRGTDTKGKMTDNDKTLIYYQGQIDAAQAMVIYWTAMAVGRINRDVFCGNKKLTPDELANDAMSTALRHAERIVELNEARDDFMSVEIRRTRKEY